jgi:hypothetical protein
MNYAIQRLHTEVGKPTRESFQWERLKAILQSPMRFQPVATQETMFAAQNTAQCVVMDTIHVRPNIIRVLKPTNRRWYVVDTHDMYADRRTVIEDVICYRSHLNFISFMTNERVYVFKTDDRFEFTHTLTPTPGCQMDARVDGTAVIVACSDHGAVCVQRLGDTDETEVLFDGYDDECIELTILDRTGTIMVRGTTELSLSTGEHVYTNHKDIRMLARLEKINQWCVCYYDKVLFFDMDGLLLWMRKGTYAAMNALDMGHIHGTHITLTSHHLTLTSNERICIYEYRGRLCIVQLTPPNAVHPTTIIKGLRTEFERVVAMLYFDRHNCIRIFTTKGLYMFGHDEYAIT